MTGTTLILQNIPEALRSKFKAACAMRNKSMKDVMTTLMEGYVNGTVKLPEKPKRHANPQTAR